MWYVPKDRKTVQPDVIDIYEREVAAFGDVERLDSERAFDQVVAVNDAEQPIAEQWSRDAFVICRVCKNWRSFVLYRPSFWRLVYINPCKP